MPKNPTEQKNSSQRGSGEEHAPEPSFVVVGRVRRPHGIRGEIRVEILTDYPERLNQHTHFYLAPPQRPEKVQKYPIESIRPHKDILLLKLGGCDERNAAEELRDMIVQVPFEEAVPLEEDEYYHFQLIDMEVETDNGEWLGRVVEVLDTGAHDVYIVHGPRGEVLLPGVEDVVLELDLEAQLMTVHIMPGLLKD